MSLFVQTLGGGQTAAGSDPATGIITSLGTTTVGNRLVVGVSSTASTSVPPTCTDSKGNTYVKVSGSGFTPNTALYIGLCTTQIAPGDTLTLSGWGIGTRNLVAIWDEIAAGSVNRDQTHSSHTASSTPSDALTTVYPLTDVIAVIGFSAALADTLTYNPESTGYEAGGFRQHTTQSTSVHLAYRQDFATGTSTYAPSPINGLSSPLSKAWYIWQASYGPADTTRMLTMLGVGI